MSALRTTHTLPSDGFVGLLIPARTGLLFRAQVGGTCCQHPALEGYFWPMNWRTWEAEQETALCDWGLQPYNGGSASGRSEVQSALNVWDLEQIFRAPTEAETVEQLQPFYKPDLVRSNPDRLVEFGEAWVPVCVRAPLPRDPENGNAPHQMNGDAPPKGMIGRCMILTYPNSD